MHSVSLQQINNIPKLVQYQSELGWYHLSLLFCADEQSDKLLYLFHFSKLDGKGSSKSCVLAPDSTIYDFGVSEKQLDESPDCKDITLTSDNKVIPYSALVSMNFSDIMEKLSNTDNSSNIQKITL